MIRSQDELIPDICVFFKETWDNVMFHMVCYSEPSGKKVLLEARHFQKNIWEVIGWTICLLLSVAS